MNLALTNSETNLMGKMIGLPIVHRIASIRSQSASRITWHSHPQFEILLLLDGSTAYEFRDNKIVELSGGHFMIIPPNVEHRGMHDVRRPARLRGIMFDADPMEVKKGLPFTLREVQWLQSQFVNGALRSHRMSVDQRNAIKSLPENFSNLDLNDPCSVATVRLCVCSVLLETARCIVNSRTYEPKLTAQEAIQVMREHISESVSIEQVARMVNCPRARLFEVFKESTGLTPNDYWQRLRIDRAQQLLTESSKTITEIALDCGFSTSQYFSSVFRKYAGVSPSDYREMGRLKPS